MASTFTIQQSGKSEKVITAYIDESNAHLYAWWPECGVYYLPISIKTDDNETPTYNWIQFVDLEVDNYFGILKYYIRNAGNNTFMLYLNPNTWDLENCNLNDEVFKEFPDGVISCDSPAPSGSVKTVEIKLKSLDETKVIIDSENNYFIYTISG